MRLCANDACCICLSKSVAGSQAQLQERGITYAESNVIGARQTFLQSNKKRTWTCLKPECSHVWIARCADICGAQKSGCPFCVNKTEALVREFVEAALSALAPKWSIQVHGRFDWCRSVVSGHVLPFDIVVLDQRQVPRVIIEVDGRQHFSDVSFGGGSMSCATANLVRDTFKSFHALQRDISMIRIAQEDVWGDKWKSWRLVLQSALRRVVERAQLPSPRPSHCCLAQDAKLYEKHFAALREAMRTGIVHGVWDAEIDAEVDTNEEEDKDKTEDVHTATSAF